MGDRPGLLLYRLSTHGRMVRVLRADNDIDQGQASLDAPSDRVLLSAYRDRPPSVAVLAFDGIRRNERELIRRDVDQAGDGPAAIPRDGQDLTGAQEMCLYTAYRLWRAARLGGRSRQPGSPRRQER
jgi:hypothetical protein